MENISAVLFDLDNTILDRGRTFRGFVDSFVRTYLPHLEEAEPIIATIMDLDEDGYKDKNKLFAELLNLLPWVEEPMHSELMNFYSTEYVKSAILMEHAEETLQYLKQKYKVGLITNGQTLIQYGKMDQLGLRTHFDLILVSEEAGVKKPNRAIFDRAVDQLGLSPEECLFIGDHPINDVEGAGKAGMETIWMEVNQPWQESVTIKPRHTIKTLRELMDLL